MPIIQLELDSKGAISSLQRFDKAVDATAAKAETSFGKMRESINKFGLMAAAAMTAAAAAAIAIGEKALYSAARMEETQNKYNVVFDGMIGKANEWSKNLTDNYGVSQRAAKEFLASTKAIIDGTRMESQAAGELSNKLVLLGQDLASFHDKSPEQAVRAMTSALTGEYESMKQFGVVIRATEVDLKAMEENNLSNKDAITQAMRAQATYTLILEKSGKAQGDTIRSYESYTFQLKQSKALLDDLYTALGVKLLPIATLYLKMLNRWVIEQDGVTKTVNATVEAVRFFDNGVRGLILVAKGITVAYAYAFTVILGGIKNMLIPLDLLLTGLKKASVIDTNPLEAMVKFSNDFLEAQVEGFDATVNGITESNAMYDKMTAAVEKTNTTAADTYNVIKEKTEKAAIVNNEALSPALDNVGVAYDTIAQKATAAGYASVAAANASIAAWNEAAAAEAEGSVGVAIGGVQQRWNGDSWVGPDSGFSGSSGSGVSSSPASAQDTFSGAGTYSSGNDLRSKALYGGSTGLGGNVRTVNINVSQAVSRSDVANIAAEAVRQESRS